MTDARQRAARALCKRAGNPENTTFEGKPMWMSYLDEVDIVLAAASPVMEWRSIDTAPKDTAILIYANGYKVAHYNVAMGKWIGYGADAETHILNSYGQPTHWQPLPEAPK